AAWLLCLWRRLLPALLRKRRDAGEKKHEEDVTLHLDLLSWCRTRASIPAPAIDRRREPLRGSAPEQSSGRDLIEAAAERRDVPVHRIGEPVVDVEQKGDLERILNRLPGHARPEHDPDILGAETPMRTRHLLEQRERRTQFLVDRRARVVVQYLPDQ